MNTFFNALMCYSRIPVPRSVRCSADTMSRALRYFPLVGIIVGSIGLGIFELSYLALPKHISLIFSMASMLLVTGAFHEDGFADFCDGFGGGYSKESILRIMKDSHIGTYGVIGLVFMIGGRFAMIYSLDIDNYIAIFIVSQAASRFAPVVLVSCSTYARVEPSKSSYTSLGLDAWGVCFAAICALAPLLLFGWIFSLIYIALIAIIFTLFRFYIYKHIGGFTGDTLGALQQICELAFYTLLIAGDLYR